MKPLPSSLPSLAILSLAPLLHAAPIDWGAPFNVGADPARILSGFDPSRNGGRALSGAEAVVLAVNFGYSGVVVNGIPFDSATGETDYWSEPGLDPELDRLLSGHTAFSEPWGVQTKSLTLTGLVPGRPYQLQLLVGHDERSAGSIRERQYEVTGGSSFPAGAPVLTRGAGKVGGHGSVVGTFVADADTQVVSIRSNRQDGNFGDDEDPAVSAYVLIGDFEDADGDGSPDNWPPAEEPIGYSTVQPLVPGESEARVIERAAKLLPRPNQVAWQRLETTFFVHFGPNTFNGVEWGTGLESPSVFAPAALDAGQWVDAVADAGGRMLVLVAKHHDGFCLWPSRYTGHDVGASPWRQGGGDVVREVAEACAARGIKLGLYLSPADLHQIERGGGYYGNGSAARLSTIPTDPAGFEEAPADGRGAAPGFGEWSYTVDDYNRYFLNQLYELLTEYGEITEVWFDGANPKPGTGQDYAHAAWYDLIRKLRPEAVIFGKGPDVRWVGNESGVARESEWSVVPLPAPPEDFNWPDMTAQDLGSRSVLAPGSWLWWYPAEADVPILNGWFWNPSKTPKAAGELVDIYYRSVGRNANLLLNLSPDSRGLVPDNQLEPLRSMAQVLANTFDENLAAEAEGGAPALLDGDPDTFWEAPEGESTAVLTFELDGAKTFDVVSLQEPIAQRGQRIEGIAVDTWSGGGWAARGVATTVGHKRLIRLGSPQTTSRVRLRITASRLNPALAEVGLFRQAVSTAAPRIGTRSVDGQVVITHPDDRPVRYTLDGGTPALDSRLYDGPVVLPLGGTIRAVAVGTDGLPGVESSRHFPGIAPTGWTADADLESEAAARAIDGDPDTSWSAGGGGTPHWLRVDMGEARWIAGFSYEPPTGGGAGVVTAYRFETSDDGVTWTVRAEGRFGNMANHPVRQDVSFAATKARWFRLVVSDAIGGASLARAGEVSVIAGGFDAWRRDRGEQSLLPDEPASSGLAALREYYLGRWGGIVGLGAGEGGVIELEFVSRAGVPDVALGFEVSEDLLRWVEPPELALSSEEGGGDWNRMLWTFRLPDSWRRSFCRAVYALE